MSQEIFRVSGKNLAVPEPAEGWTFERRPGGWVVAVRTRSDGSTERKRFFVHEAKGRLSFSIDGSLYHGGIEAQVRATSGAAGSDRDLLAQFPGKVRKILVDSGAIVEAGTPLVLIEAMKMEFSVKAPFSGRVERILVREGQQLSPGDRFLDLTPEAKRG